MANNADIELLASLDMNSSEQEILKAIKVLQSRIQSNSSAKIKVNAQIDESDITKTLEKLQKILKNKDISIDTKNSIVGIQQEASAMLDVVSSANKAAKEKLEFAKANKKVKESADDTTGAINRERNAMHSMENIDYILRNINIQGRNGNSVFQQFGNTLRDAFYAYSAANLLQDAIYKVIDGGKEAVETVKELNDAATSLRMATGESSEYINQLMSSYNTLGQELGAITTDVSESADEWLRQGHTINDTNKLIQDSMMLSKVSNLNSADSTKYLTSAMQGYKVAVEDVVGIVDKLSAVDLESATDAGGLAEAMSRTAEGAQIAGISMDRLLGMIATVGEVTQKSMSSIGESYKTVFSRMRDIKDDKLSVVGDDGEIEDLSNVEIVLNSLGIKLRESNQEFRNFQIVLDEVAASWDSYSSVQKAAIAKAFSGVRQQENFLVMMENWDKVVEYTNVASQSSGTAQEKFGYYLESLEAKTNSLKASLEKLASTTISDELYGSILDIIKGLVDATTESGILKGALAGLGTAGAVFAFEHLVTYLRDTAQEFSNLSAAMEITRNGSVAIDEMEGFIELTNGLSSSQTRLLLSTTNLTDAQKIAILMGQGMSQEEATLQIQTWGVATAETGATQATITFSSALRGLWATLMANPLVLVTTAVTVGVMAWNKYKQAQEEAGKALEESVSKFEATTEEVNKLEDELKTCRDRLAELQALADKGTISVAEEKELETLQKQNKELERKLALKQQEQIEDQEEVLEDNEDALHKKVASDYIHRGSNTGKTYVTPEEELNAAIDAYNRYSKLLEEDPTNEYVKEQLKSASNRIKEMYNDHLSDSINAYDKIIEAGGKLDAEHQAEYEGLKKTQGAYLEYVYTLNGNKEAYEALNTEQQRSILLDRLKEKGLSDNEQNAVMNSLSDDDLNNLWDADFDFTPPQMKDYDSAEEYGKAYAQAWLNGVKEKTSTQEDDKTESEPASFTEAWKDLDNPNDDIYKNTKKELTELADAGMLTVDAFKKVEGAEQYFEKIGLNAEEATKKINELTDSSKPLATLKTAIGSLQDAYAEKKEYKVVASDTLSKMEETFGNLSYWEKYEKIAGSSTTTTEELRQAQNKLATEYVNSGEFLSNLTKENQKYYESQLKEMGVLNASDVVKSALDQKYGALNELQMLDLSGVSSGAQSATKSMDDLDSASADVMMELAGVAGTSETTRNYLLKLAMTKINWDGLNAGDAINMLESIAKAAGVTVASIAGAKEAYNSLANFKPDFTNPLVSNNPFSGNNSKDTSKDTKKYDVKGAVKQATEDLNNALSKTSSKINIKINPTKTGKNAGSGSGSSSKSSKQEFDLLGRYIDRLNSKISLLNAQKENLFTVKKKNGNLDKQISKTTKLINAYSVAGNKYQKKADKIEFSKDKKKDKKFKEKIQNGKVKGKLKDLIKEYGEDTANKIQEYQKWYDLSESEKQNKAEARTKKRELQIEKYQNYVDDFDAKANLNDLMANSTSLSTKERNKYIGKEKDNLRDSYKYQIKIAKANKDTTEQKRLQAEKEQKLLELSRAVLDNTLAEKDNQLSSKQSYADSIQSDLSILEARGIGANAGMYTNLSKNADEQKKILQSKNADLEKYLKDNKIKEGTEEWYDIQQQIDDNNASVKDLTQSQIEWNNTIQEMRLDKFKNLADLLDGIKSKFQALLSLNQTQGYTESDSDIAKEIKMGNNQIATNKGQINQQWNNLLEDARKDKSDPTGFGWGLSSYQAEKFKASYQNFLNGVIDQSQFEEDLKSIGLTWEQVINNSKVQEGIKNINSLETENLNIMTEQEQKFDELAKKRIDAINDYIDKLKEANDQESKAIELEKLQQKLQAAKQNKSIMVYREGYGFTYEADQSAVNEAQSALDDAQFDAFMDKLSKVVELIQKGIDNGDINLYDKDGKSLGDVDTLIKTYLSSIGSTLAESFGDLEFYTGDKGKVLVRQKGNAYANGVVNAPKGADSLVAEEKPEILVRDGQWNLLDKTQFIDTKPGDIIIDGDKTEELLKKGYVESSGRAFNQGRGNYTSYIRIKPWEAWENLPIIDRDKFDPFLFDFNSMRVQFEQMYGQAMNRQIKQLEQAGLNMIQPRTVENNTNRTINIQKVEMSGVNDVQTMMRELEDLATINSTAKQRAWSNK